MYKVSKQFINLLITTLRGVLRLPFKGLLNLECGVVICAAYWFIIFNLFKPFIVTSN